MRRLTELGVDVSLGVAMQVMVEEGVVIESERVRAMTVGWNAGVKPSPAGKWRGTLVDHRAGVRIQTDLTVRKSEHLRCRKHGIA